MRSIEPEGNCSSKWSYSTYQEARKALKVIKKHRTPNRKERAVYRCEHCGMFHLTSRPQKQQYHARLQKVYG